MPQSLVQLYIHIVFSTKDRTPFLRDKPFRERLHAYLTGACERQGCPSIRIGGVEDHVHLFLRLGSSADVSTMVRELKRESSKWVKEELDQKDFHWQSGYGAYSVSPSHIDALVGYIRVQEDHHKKETFQDEFRRLCTKYGAALDERYVWE